MNTEWIGALGAIAGAAATETLRVAGRARRGRLAAEHRRGQTDALDAQKLRDELWVEIRDLRRRLDEMNAALEKSRLAYIELLGKYTELHAEHKALELEHADVKSSLAALKAGRA